MAGKTNRLGLGQLPFAIFFFIAQNISKFMKFVADLHLHSKYSRAVSPQMILTEMAKWAKYKGINVLGTGDFTHPFWLDRLRTELEETDIGLFRLKTNAQRLTPDKNNQALDISHSAFSEREVLFLLSCEISSIYSQGGQTRRIHNLFFFPKMSSVEKFNGELLKRGANLRSDGRPIVGINSRDLAAMAFECDEKALVIPAHAWTPWFSVFGSFSGFDSIGECFGDMAENIYAIETGLSSDPVMNWQVGDLDKRAILSFSDAHSLEKMGREATVFEADEVSYDSIYQAIAGPVARHPRPTSSPALSALLSEKSLSAFAREELTAGARRGPPTRITRNQSNNLTMEQFNNARIAFTIEFHPEEGKYHYTGHRDCNFSQLPEETKKNGNICPVCHRPLTVGVMHRVEDLSSREISNSEVSLRKSKYQISNGVRWVQHPDVNRPPYVSLVPLLEILAEALGAAFKTKKVMDVYLNLINNLGSEFNVLLKADLEEIAKLASPRVAEGVEKVRSGNIVVEPGYDGKYGVVKIWNGESQQPDDPKGPQEAQLGLF